MQSWRICSRFGLTISQFKTTKPTRDCCFAPPAAAETRDQAAAIEKLAEKLIQREPHSLPHRTLLALALLRQERAEDALRVYSDLQVKQDAVSGSALAVHAAILAATANLENAKTEAAQLKREQLLPEEQALVESLLDS